MGSATAKSFLALSAATAILALPCHARPQKKPKHAKAPEVRVENYFGGLFITGDGGIPNGPCFRIKGRVTSSDFFNDLKSFDSDDGVIFRRGSQEVTQFPGKLLLAMTIRDQPCSDGLQPVGTGSFLTEQEMSSLQLSFYWKSGVDLRPSEKITLLNFSVTPIEPYAKDLASELPKRYLWSYEVEIPADGVALTDSLVLVFRNQQGRIVARVAARL